MKARIENGVIKVFGALPGDFGNILNFKNADTATHKSHGFFDVVEPAFDPDLKQRTELYFDAQNEVFTYGVTDRLIDMEQEKQRKLLEFEKEFDSKRHELMLATYELVIDALRENLPQDVVSLYDQLKTMKQVYVQEIESRSLLGVKELKSYKVQPLDSQAVSQAISSLKR